jgi:formiminotetrahydrofolate cyclodeaminase
MSQKPEPSSSALIDLSVARFTDRLAERTPTPGGGSMAACLTACGSALGAMAFRFTSGEKYAAIESAMARRVEALERVRAAALPLVDRDTQAYDAVTAAYKLPKSTEPEKTARTAAIQKGLKGALEVPHETLELSIQAMRLVAEGVDALNPNLASDAATGATCLWSACESALLNVTINAASIHDKAWAQERLDKCRALCEESSRLLAAVKTSVARHLAPK